MKTISYVFTFLFLMGVGTPLLAQFGGNRFSDSQVDEINKGMRERAAAEAKAVPQARPASSPPDSPKNSPESVSIAKKELPESVAIAKKELAQVDLQLKRNSMGLESADDHQLSVGEMNQKYGADWATSKDAQAKISKDAAEKKRRLATQKSELEQRRVVLNDYLSHCKLPKSGCKP